MKAHELKKMINEIPDDADVIITSPNAFEGQGDITMIRDVAEMDYESEGIKEGETFYIFIEDTGNI
jgi:hypothetical protein